MFALPPGSAQRLKACHSDEWKELTGPAWLNMQKAVTEFLFWLTKVANADRLAGRVGRTLKQHSVEDLRILIKATMQVAVPQQKTKAPFSKPHTQPVFMAIRAQQTEAGTVPAGTAESSAPASSVTWWGARVQGGLVVCNRFVKCSNWTHAECMARCILWHTTAQVCDTLRLRVEAPPLLVQSWRAACEDMRVHDPNVTKLRSAQQLSESAIARNADTAAPRPAPVPRAPAGPSQCAAASRAPAPVAAPLLQAACT
jgi:hypothetical protein